MSMTIKDGAMVVLAAGGVLALTATAEFGLPALALGVSMSLISGTLAVNGRRAKISARPGSQHERELKVPHGHQLAE
jgi:hypothetical protein